MKLFCHYIKELFILACLMLVGRNSMYSQSIAPELKKVQSKDSFSELLVDCARYVHHVETGEMIPPYYDIEGGCFRQVQLELNNPRLADIKVNVIETLNLLADLPCKFTRNQFEAIC